MDAWLTELMTGAPLVVALVLGLRHATDPDHLVAVTSLAAADDGVCERRPASVSAGVSGTPGR